jgi:ubiquinone/menaquinone biosynthesis C-methylase UbiE
MDDYTAKTKEWLEGRFRTADEAGIYVAHQPIYGFKKGHCDTGYLERYILTYQIMKALSSLKFSTLLDVGGAEGYKSSLAARIFAMWAVSCDLSEEACKRTREIFGTDSAVADIHDLPFSDGAFEVVLCSETLEHVTDIRRAMLELLRVAGKAVVITVPTESHETVERNIEEEIPHGHINTIDVRTFERVAWNGCRIVSRKMLSTPVRRLEDFLEPARRTPNGKYAKAVFDLYNALVPALDRLAGTGSIDCAIWLDGLVSKTPVRCGGLLCVLLKDGAVWTESSGQRVSPRQVTDFKVPYHFLGRQVQGRGAGNL